MRRARFVTAAVVVVLLATLAACSKQPGPEKAVNAFLDGWRAGTFAPTVTLVDGDGNALTGDTVAQQIKSMSGDLATAKPTLAAGKAKVTKQDATVPLSLTWPVATGVTWTYQTTIPMSYKDSKWRVIWSTAIFQPDMKATDKLGVRRSSGPRGQIVDGSGAAITSNQTIVDIGVQPSLVTDLDALVKALDAAFKSLGKDIDISDLPGRVKSASANAFVDVVSLRDSDYQKIKAQIHDLPGTVFRSRTGSLAISSTFARALLGTVGDVTKEQMDKSPGKYQVGDQVGSGGLQGRYDDQLQGRPGVSVVIPAPKEGDSTDKTDKVLFHTDAAPGTTIKTTLDIKIQQAAEQTLAGTGKHSSLVAIRISDGAILAVANGPGGYPINNAFNAQVPPGSMFKAVTATNLLEAGKISTDTKVNCPKTLVVDGYTISNAGGEVLGNVPLLDDFAYSCNTAFASLAPQLGPTGLRDTAAVLGIGVPWDLGIDAYTGKVSANGNPTEQAAAAFGQGTTTISPLVMASAAAAIARGQFKQPHLLVDPAAAKPAADGPKLKQSTVDAMKLMMRKVVTDGTGKGCKNVAGDPVYGKTGTAEHGSTNPADTHSWFMGFRGDIAFAVFVEDGGASTAAAVPLTAQFFKLIG